MRLCPARAGWGTGANGGDAMKRTCVALLLAALGCVGCCGTGGKCWNASEKKVGHDSERPPGEGWKPAWTYDPDDPEQKPRPAWYKGDIY